MSTFSNELKRSASRKFQALEMQMSKMQQKREHQMLRRGVQFWQDVCAVWGWTWKVCWKTQKFATGVPKLLLEKGACSRAWCFASGMSRAQAGQFVTSSLLLQISNSIEAGCLKSSLLQTSCETSDVHRMYSSTCYLKQAGACGRRPG